MKRLIPAPLPVTPDFDPCADYPEDVERMVAAAANAGYQVTPRDAAELWRRHSGDLCASWFAVDGADQYIVTALLKHAEVHLDEQGSPPPPEGYANWLGFAADSMDQTNLLIRSTEFLIWPDLRVRRQAEQREDATVLFGTDFHLA